jgi:hypothetical protein
MTNRRVRILVTPVLAALMALSFMSLSSSSLRAEIAFEPTWQPADYESVRADVLKWLTEAKADDGAAEKIRDLWPKEAPAEVTPATLLDRVAASFALASSDAKGLVSRCSRAYDGPTTTKPDWLASSANPDFMRNNLRLYYARWLAQYGLYDEVLEQVADLRPADVCDPASLLFYQMAAYHQLVRPDEARAALVELMEHEEQLPRRYQQVAQLVQHDLSGLEDESLDHIARRMRDIRRRLDYGRAGAKVQQVEKGVLDSLDKKIDDLEKQQQQQQQSASAAGGTPKSLRPMQDSRIAELKAPMQVDRRDIGHKSGWGDLPPKQREQALQQIGREFPAHYRELIEDYFRELANESTAPAPAATTPPPQNK